ncbi:hypothetical protein GCK32_011781 [Trichostrongylus colubriformis]|uniref:Uncharacterized protein n=1 Tax=Trichostrongylus colubriformis TaxID=6319 RepID=A0AAN8IVD3_TRICO
MVFYKNLVQDLRKKYKAWSGKTAFFTKTKRASLREHQYFVEKPRLLMTAAQRDGIAMALQKQKISYNHVTYTVERQNSKLSMQCLQVQHTKISLSSVRLQKVTSEKPK